MSKQIHQNPRFVLERKYISWIAVGILVGICVGALSLSRRAKSAPAVRIAQETSTQREELHLLPPMEVGRGNHTSEAERAELLASLKPFAKPAPISRAPGEWTGMRVDASIVTPCEEAAHCGLGLACKDGKCGACTLDSDCAVAERCVLDHCILASNVACVSVKSCAAGELCILTGYDNTPRGTRSTRSICISPHGGTEQTDQTIPEGTQPRQSPPVNISRLQGLVEQRSTGLSGKAQVAP